MRIGPMSTLPFDTSCPHCLQKGIEGLCESPKKHGPLWMHECDDHEAQRDPWGVRTHETDAFRPLRDRVEKGAGRGHASPVEAGVRALLGLTLDEAKLQWCSTCRRYLSPMDKHDRASHATEEAQREMEKHEEGVTASGWKDAPHDPGCRAPNGPGAFGGLDPETCSTCAAKARHGMGEESLDDCSQCGAFVRGDICDNCGHDMERERDERRFGRIAGDLVEMAPRRHTGESPWECQGCADIVGFGQKMQSGGTSYCKGCGHAVARGPMFPHYEGATWMGEDTFVHDRCLDKVKQGASALSEDHPDNAEAWQKVIAELHGAEPEAESEEDGKESKEKTSAVLCSVCGTTARQPGSGGRVLHTFKVDESVRSTAGMRGVIIKGPQRHNGYKIRWENGAEGWTRVPDLDHDSVEKESAVHLCDDRWVMHHNFQPWCEDEDLHHWEPCEHPHHGARIAEALPISLGPKPDLESSGRSWIGPGRPPGRHRCRRRSDRRRSFNSTRPGSRRSTPRARP